jgi:EAL domain-containing protein (putative c-di-GMP-specific phosphodiesterase class I)
MTETVLIQVTEANASGLDELKRMGVGLAIDDSRTGYSSLFCLKRIPADILKIDRSFIRGLGKGIEDHELVRTIIDLAHTFGLETTAEGVESAEQAELLREMGCDMGQGYYFSEPLSSEAMGELLSKGS